MKRIPLASSLVVVAASLATPVVAETLRCGSVLIQPGATQGYVAEKCGEPTSKQTFTEPVMARRDNGTAFEVGTTSKDVWRYRRGSGQFPAVLTFEMGVLKTLVFEK